ncbi:MAG: hypothetical protein HYY08_01435 [Firmicutes bacterium]|nr:hypothetical protein [Bacillota bacterium]
MTIVTECVDCGTRNVESEEFCKKCGAMLRPRRINRSQPGWHGINWLQRPWRRQAVQK